jgi:phosphate transport system substrate-binding protein
VKRKGHTQFVVLVACSGPKGISGLAARFFGEFLPRRGEFSQNISFPNSERNNVCFRGFWPSILVLALVGIAASQYPDKLHLVGVGTTSPLPVYSVWFQAFEKTRSDIRFSYIPSGSGTGIDMVTSGAADFGATDAPLTGKQLANAKVVQFATVLVAIVPIYNIEGARRPLKFSPQALAGIYLGTITKWNDPAISGLNPEVELPARNIAVIHSAGGRGSTYIWSDYLSKVSEAWRTRVGRGIEVEWPVGKEADGNGNLAKMVKSTPDSIGYVELVHALQNRLPYGQVQNAAGNFVSASAATITAAAATARSRPGDFRASITNAPGERSYPISSFTWILVSEKMESTAKHEAVKDFLRWALGEGQTFAESPGFARLPGSIVEQELTAIENLP